MHLRTSPSPTRWTPDVSPPEGFPYITQGHMGAVLTEHLPTAWHQPIIQIRPQAWSVVSLLCKQITGTIHEPVGVGGGRCSRSRCRGHPSHLLRRVCLHLSFPLESDPTHIFSGDDGCCYAHPMSRFGSLHPVYDLQFRSQCPWCLWLGDFVSLAFYNKIPWFINS